MRTLRLHSKVALWWGRWWAVQLYLFPQLSLGVRLELRRPLVDLYLGPLTVAVGRLPHITPAGARHADSCRGFLFADEVL